MIINKNTIPTLINYFILFFLFSFLLLCCWIFLLCFLVRQVHDTIEDLSSSRLWGWGGKGYLASIFCAFLQLLCKLFCVDLLPLLCEGLVGLEVLEVAVPGDVDEACLLGDHLLHSVRELHRGFVRTSHLGVQVPHVAHDSPACQEIINMSYKGLLPRVPKSITEDFALIKK